MMSFFRIKTVKGRRYLYKQTSVREGKKVRSIMEYFGSFNGVETYGSTTSRNADLKVTQNPKRPDYDDEHMRHLFKTDRAAFDRLHSQKYGRQQETRDRKTAWAEKNMSRSEKQERAEAKQAAEAKFAETNQAVKEFSESLAEKSSTSKV
jgi:hypothetical protein